MSLMFGSSSLSSLPLLRDYASRRSSSFDKDGNNSDWWTFEPGDVKALLETDRPGCVKHIWMTVGNGGEHHLRRLVLRMYWDGEETPSVEVPLGDFFLQGRLSGRGTFQVVCDE
ncbi:MAG TPA: DUF2961 domain-containing protein, partial [Fimbriimonadaceae bacterium]|nr:DUF2961 domain-containing protein [Fimbriimonadaceae bacterium]